MLRRIATLIGSGLLLSAASISASAGPLGCESVHTQDDGLESLRGCSITLASGAFEASARALLDQESSTLGIVGGEAALELIQTKNGLGTQHIRFRQLHQGLPIFDSLVSVHTGLDGKVRMIHRRVFDVDSQLKSTTAALNAEEAAAFARAGVARESSVSPIDRLAPRSELGWFADESGNLTLAWRSMVFLGQPLGDYLTVVDANRGTVLFQENRIAFGQVTGSGLVYIPNPYQTQGNSTNMVDGNDATNATLDAERISVTLEGLDDNVDTLKGEFVDLVSLPGGLAVPDASEPTRVYEYDRSDDRFEQVVIYHSIDSIQRYFHSLGFDDDTGTPNGIRDYPTLANAHWYTQDQSFYSTGDDAVHFGDGGVDDGEDADIIAHEYGHAVQHNQNASWGSGEMGAMGEAFGDYLAMSFYYDNGDAAYQAINNPCVGEWDAVSYSGTNPPCLRRTDGTKHYPEDLVGQVHADGEIWSRALWDIRNAIGGPTTDQIVLEHHFSLPGGATMVTAANEMLAVDVTLNGGANDAALRTAFCDRGFLNDAGPECVIDTSEIFADGFESGDTLAWSASSP